jgi:endonuclease III
MMAPSRITEQTSKYFSTMPARRAASEASDIEDAIPDLDAPRKRKRNTAAVVNGAKIVKTEKVGVAGRALRSASSRVTRTTGVKTEAAPPKEETEDTKPSPKARKTRTPAKIKVDPETGSVHATPPSDWEEMYAAVKAMRQPGGAASNAAVDTMGCERLATSTDTPKERRFHTLIALMLSSQTKDTANAIAMARLKAELPAHRAGAKVGLTLDNILAVDPDLLNQLIWNVGFHNNKTRYIKAAAQILRDQWAGDIPDSVEGLMALPGVGPKMAYLCMAAPHGWDRVEGIGVDVHVHRITNLWGWHATRTPEETRLALQAWLPRDRWREINGLLVGLGQKVCLPVGRKCGDCELGLKGLCRAADRKKVGEGRRKREIYKKLEGDSEEGPAAKEEEEEVLEKVEVVKTEKIEETSSLPPHLPLLTADERPSRRTSRAASSKVVKKEEDGDAP